MSRRTRKHPEFMKLALQLAEKAFEQGEIPVGAIVVHEGKVIGRGFNLREQNKDPLGHAEIEAIREASQNLGSWRIPRSTLYVTLEPCTMCSGAILQSRIERVVFGAYDSKAGAVRSLYTTLEDPRQPHRVQVIGGVLEEESRALLTRFFQKLRCGKSGSE